RPAARGRVCRGGSSAPADPSGWRRNGGGRPTGCAAAPATTTASRMRPAAATGCSARGCTGASTAAARTSARPRGGCTGCCRELVGRVSRTGRDDQLQLTGGGVAYRRADPAGEGAGAGGGGGGRPQHPGRHGAGPDGGRGRRSAAGGRLPAAPRRRRGADRLPARPRRLGLSVPAAVAGQERGVLLPTQGGGGPRSGGGARAAAASPSVSPAARPSHLPIA